MPYAACGWNRARQTGFRLARSRAASTSTSTSFDFDSDSDLGFGFGFGFGSTAIVSIIAGFGCLPGAIAALAIGIRRVHTAHRASGVAAFAIYCRRFAVLTFVPNPCAIASVTVDFINADATVTAGDGCAFCSPISHDGLVDCGARRRYNVAFPASAKEDGAT